MTRQQLNRTVQALNETYTIIAKMESPKALSRDENLLVFYRQHAVNLSTMINEYQA